MTQALNSLAKEELILASQSPRRSALLRSAGIVHRVIPSDVDESFDPALHPAEQARVLAHRKALAVAQQYPTNLVLGADTVVVLPQRNSSPSQILSKPESSSDAEGMLQSLSDRDHLVLTAFILLRLEPAYSRDYVATTKVCFRKLHQDEISAYIATKEPMDKAGAYAIQGGAAGFVREVHGSYTNVVGLPLAEVIEALGKVPWT